jgi:hypothetical protein
MVARCSKRQTVFEVLQLAFRKLSRQLEKASCCRLVSAVSFCNLSAWNSYWLSTHPFCDVHLRHKLHAQP